MSTKIQALALDVDGTLTDGSVLWSTGGEESKRFHFLDIMGLARIIKAGIPVALISGEDSPLVDRLASKVGITSVYKGCKKKDLALAAFVESVGLTLGDVCFMGDDINDLPALRTAGLNAAPCSAHPIVLREAEFISERPAGSGAVRCLIDHLWGEFVTP